MPVPATTEPFQYWLGQLQSPPLQSVGHPLLTEKSVSLKVLRTDLVHPVISGNKSYKLQYNLKAALEQRARGVLSFGGAWSNHLHALAYSCYLLKLPCVAVIRGEPELVKKSAMLNDLQDWGAQLHFVNRKNYRLRDDPDWLATLSDDYPGYYLIPEGGSSALAQPGVMALAQQLEQACRAQHWQPDQVWCAVGTGGTLAGLIAGRSENYQLIGVPVLKGAEFLVQSIRDRLAGSGLQTNEGGSLSGQSLQRNWQLRLDGHFGGYAKAPQALLQQMADLTAQVDCFAPEQELLLDPVYTGKLFCRFWQALSENEFPPHSRILLLHSGGLQGRRGYGL